MPKAKQGEERERPSQDTLEDQVDLNSRQESGDKTSELFAILLLGLGLLLGFLLWAPSRVTGALGRGFSSLALGFLGSFGLALPLLFLFLAGTAYWQKDKARLGKQYFYLLIFILLVLSLLSVLSLDLDLLATASLKEGRQSAWEAVKLYWESGSKPGLLSRYAWWSGGLVGNLQAAGLIALVGKTGSLIILIPMLLALAILIFGVSWRKTFLVTANKVSQTGHLLGSWGKEVREKRKTMQEAKAEARQASDYEEASDFEFGVDPQGEGQAQTVVPEPPPAAETTKLAFDFPQGNWLKDDFGNPPSLAYTLQGERRPERVRPRPFPGHPAQPEATQPEVGIRAAFIPLKEDYLMYAQGETREAESNLGKQESQGVREPAPNLKAEGGDLAQIAARIQEGEDNLGAHGREDWEDRAADRPSQRSKGKTKAGQTDIFTPYLPPSTNLLIADKQEGEAENKEEIRLLGAKLEKTLHEFGVEAKVVNFMTGPTISRFEVKPGPGVKVSNIVKLSDDIALALAATSVRIEAPIPGKSAVGIEIPNKKTKAVRLRNLLESREFRQSKSLITAALGRNIQGDPILCDLASMPHLLIAGATGSGKSVCINSILISLLYKASPRDLRLIMIDPKVVELSVYNGIPHLETPVVTDPKKAYGALEWAVQEMERRYRLFADNSVRDFKAYNELVQEEAIEDGEHLPLILLVIDELSDLMATTAKEVESAIARLTAMARAAGIHLIIATQRPSVNVITGVIKANIPSRISFAVTSQVDSRTILDMVGAEKLLGKGDMLYYPQSAAKPLRGQGAFVTDGEVEKVVSYLKGLYSTEYNESLKRDLDKVANPQVETSGSGGEDEEEDDLIYEALQTVLDSGYASTSLLQRRLNVGYPRAGRLIDTMHERGWIGPFEGSKPRKLTIDRAEAQEIIELNS
ncbi:MAG: DNA translocase FtsK 4TM domain-containing protein [Eubacteriales bacterium]|nr:DNA translocase FtsK 4TM domain-containing protein [Eubacteriales bacterium]